MRGVRRSLTGWIMHPNLRPAFFAFPVGEGPLPTELLPQNFFCTLVLWLGKDSNLRTRLRTDLQSVAFNRSATYPILLSLEKNEKKIIT